VKPVNLNQLLFHTKTSTLSFFQSPVDSEELMTDFEQFLADMLVQLQLQGKTTLMKLLEKNKSTIKKILKSHPNNSHGFFISEGLQGYMSLENKLETYCIIGQTFHVRPILEELFVNPEYMVVNVSLYDIKVYRGDFHHLEIVQQYDFDEMNQGPGFQERFRVYAPPQLGLVPYKTILALKTIAQKVREMTLYDSLPVLITGLAEMKEIFLRFFETSFGVITHLEEDFYEKTCIQILDRCKNFRPIVMDYYSAQLKERLKKMVKSKRLISDLGEIIKAAMNGKIVHLVLPTEKKLWGKLDLQTGEYEIHKKAQKRNHSIDILNELAEEVMRNGGRIQILGPHFFPQESHVLAILRG
jgi:hypothetical protein